MIRNWVRISFGFDACFFRRREQFFFRHRRKLISTFRYAFGLCFEVMKEALQSF